MNKHTKHTPQDAEMAQVVCFPIPLDWSGDVDATVSSIEHTFDGNGQVVSLLARLNRTTEGTPWSATETDADHLRRVRTRPDASSPTGPARPNTEQADGLVSPGAHVPSTLPANDLTGERSTDIGTLTHRLIAQHAATASLGRLDENLPQLLLRDAYKSIRAIPARRRVLAIQALSHAHRYLTAYVPQGPWVLLGVEYPCAGRRVDVAWQHTDTGEVFFDEVKTSATAAAQRTPESWVKQTRRYSVAGSERFGDGFLGTRLLPVATPHTSVLVRAEGAPVLIAPTPADPLRVKAVTR